MRSRSAAVPVVMTSNCERELPPAFRRRGPRLDIRVPDEVRLNEIIEAHLGPQDAPEVRALVADFLLPDWTAAVEAFTAGEWGDTYDTLAKQFSADPGAHCLLRVMDRSQRRAPPDWDGVFVPESDDDSNSGRLDETRVLLFDDLSEVRLTRCGLPGRPKMATQGCPRMPLGTLGPNP